MEMYFKVKKIGNFPEMCHHSGQTAGYMRAGRCGEASVGIFPTDPALQGRFGDSLTCDMM